MYHSGGVGELHRSSFDNISKTLTPDFTYLNDNIFAIQNGCTKKEFDAEMRQLREQIASEQEMKGKTEKK